MRAGVLGEFESAEAWLEAARTLRQYGYSRLDGFMPYLVPGAEEAFSLSRSRLPVVVLVMALLGAGGAYLLQWYTVAVDYVLNVGGRPPHSPPVFVPITFEMGVLFAAFTSVITVFIWSGLPRPWHPVFEIPGFESASIDRFWVGVDVSDPAFEPDALKVRLRELGAARIVELRGGGG